MERLLIVLTLALSGACKPTSAWRTEHLSIIHEGMGCAQARWAGYNLPDPDVLNIMMGDTSIPCAGHDEALACFKALDKAIYVRVWGMPRTEVVNSVAHEWSHAMWWPLYMETGYDPTHEPEDPELTAKQNLEKTDKEWNVACFGTENP